MNSQSELARAPAKIRICFLATILSLAAPYSVSANPICAAVATLLGPDASITQLTLPPPFSGSSKCSSALAQSGGRFTYCAWPFDYRAPVAHDAFKQLVDAVPTCLGLGVEGENDQKVNHPDFYDLQVFKSPQAEVSVSLKDKAGLQETYVFLRVQPAR